MQLSRKKHTQLSPKFEQGNPLRSIGNAGEFPSGQNQPAHSGEQVFPTQSLARFLSQGYELFLREPGANVHTSFIVKTWNENERV